TYLRVRHLHPGLSSPLPEPLDLSAGVHDALRAREERMADGADLRLELLARGTGRERVPACAGHDRVFVVGGMDLCFQGDDSWGSLPSERDEQTLGLVGHHAQVKDETQPGRPQRQARLR